MADDAAPAPAAKPAKKSSPKKKSKPKKPANHPKYSDMIRQAIGALKERGGSSRQAILKYIVKNFNVGKDEKVVNQHLKMSLRAGVKNGSLKQAKGTGAAGSFRLGEEKKKSHKKAAKPKKPKAKKAKKPKKAKTAKPKKAKTAKPKKAGEKKPKKAKKAKSPAKAKKPKAKKPKAKKAAAKKA